MANIVISDLKPVELDYTELSDLELESIVGGKWNWKKILEVALLVVVVGLVIDDNL
ncbi:hypothetical protein [Crocosphaera sp.]|uniref:hypothetical protein n=1 Tax=Crocosphaera sp. TaxID=2729996 RepID=UPI00260CA531|nr:hypothetical protein [Crocosphaera sp.]MDJ0579141.1 hypothetical protein [Crocosphaera sp.]